MAKVEMDLQELKALENQIKEAEEALRNKDKELNDKEKALIELESNKRILKKTEYKSGIEEHEIVLRNSKEFSYDTGYQLLNKLTNHIVSKLFSGKYGDVSGKAEKIKESLSGFRFKLAFNNQEFPTTTEYINFEDVQRELREAAEKSVAEELGQLRVRTRDLEARIESVRIQEREESERKLNNLDKRYKEEIEKINEAYMQVKDEYDDLKEDRDTRTTEEKLNSRIEELENKLYEAENKPWYIKLFS